MHTDSQLLLPLGPVRNSELFSNHWLSHRLRLEPEWAELRDAAVDALESIRELWGTQESRVELYDSEAALEDEWIKPIFQALGWEYIPQASIDRRTPDYALFVSDSAKEQALHESKGSPQFWRAASVVADAKAWSVSLDRPARVSGSKEYPPEQLEWYLRHTGVGWGILTNGRLWRLIPGERPVGRPRFDTYLEVDLPELLRAALSGDQLEFGREDMAGFMYFFLLFGPAGFRGDHRGRVPLVKRALSGSSEYAVGVSEGLRERVFDALQLGIEGFLHYNDQELDPASDLETCRTQTFVLLYRLLFVMYAEDRGLLPYRRNETYTRNRSLARLRDEVAASIRRRGVESFSDESNRIWQDLTSLFDLVNSGHATYEVPHYNGGLFSSEEHKFLERHAISDRYMARIIDKLGRAVDESHPDYGLFRVDYRDLAIRQLGTVYEGLLELRPRYASEPMIVVRRESGKKKGTERVVPTAHLPVPQYVATDQVFPPGTVYLETEKGERRATGSYYTPDHVVDRIVEETLGPLCKSITDGIGRELALLDDALGADTSDPANGRLADLYERVGTSFDDRVLELRVLDPAMGSGHFLVRACQYLAEEIATNPYTGDPEVDDSADESALAHWKRRVVERCLFGVDLNPLAVELAKLGLWLETVSMDRPLTFLDHRLRVGNSLIGASLDRLAEPPGGTPLLDVHLEDQIKKQRKALVLLSEEISNGPSDTPEEVKAKARLMRRLDSETSGLRALSDIWCGLAMDHEDHRPALVEDYREVAERLGRPRVLADHLSEQPVGDLQATVRKSVQPFHWQLEFPSVMMPADGPAGFDAVIGNPPYDVIASKELGRDIEPEKRAYHADPSLEASFVGKNNLFKLFICRAVALLQPGGRLGFIVPMALLGDFYSKNVRRLLLESGRLASVDAFPQKDRPAERVFPEAKLSTTVFQFVASEGDVGPEDSLTEIATHPGRTFEDDSPRLRIKASLVSSFDPSNWAIPACSQDDWDLVEKLMADGRTRRLGELCPSYQGELNEKTDSDRGFISEAPDDGTLVLRGSNVTRYAIRAASQGEELFVRVDKLLSEKTPGSKAFHSNGSRVVFQRSAPQNNYRRLIAARLDPGNFCFDTISYVPDDESELPPTVLTALLNSKLLDWYFRLSSTNSKVNQYQFENLPCPIFGAPEIGLDAVAFAGRVLNDGASGAVSALPVTLFDPPLPSDFVVLIDTLVRRIESAEKKRGEISRRDRADLSPRAEAYQDAIDRLLFRAFGLSDSDLAHVSSRLDEML